MSTPSGFLQLLVRCPRCEARNVVDLRRQGLAHRARCGRCGEPLPRRIPAPLLLLGVTTLVVVAGLAHFVIAALHERSAAARRARVVRYLEEHRADEAVHLLPKPRVPASDDWLLGKRVAEELAAPVLAADADPSSGRATVEQAVELGGQLLDDHEDDLPELLAVVDDPMRRLQARRIAFEMVEDAEGEASAPMPDLDRVDRALEKAAVDAVQAPADVAAEVELLSHGIRARAALARARGLVAKRPDEARQLLVKMAQRLPQPKASGRHDAAPAADQPHPATLLEAVTLAKDAVASRDSARLATAARLRPDPSWSTTERAELDREVQRACQALASVSSAAAAAEIDPEKRADDLLAAMTCDELLPRDFLAQSRAALADTLVEAARRGGSLEDALLAWDDVASPMHDRDLAALGCLAEARGSALVAVHAWARIGQPQAFARLGRCAEEGAAKPVLLDPPSMAYPAPGS